VADRRSRLGRIADRVRKGRGGVEEIQKGVDAGLAGGRKGGANGTGGRRAALDNLLDDHDIRGHLLAVGGDAIDGGLEGLAAAGDGGGGPVGDIPLGDAHLGVREAAGAEECGYTDGNSLSHAHEQIL